MPLALLPIRSPATKNRPHYDVFVSYSTLDNADGWVTEFIARLKNYINQQLGERDSNRVWWDQDRVESMEPLTPQIQDRVSRSRLLLVLLSPGYQKSKWCQLERQFFFEKYREAKSEQRILLVDLGILGRTERPNEFQDLRSEDFFSPKEAGADKGPLLGEPKPIEGHPPHVPFFTAVKNLAGILAKRLKSQP
jgi:hypothetical protein